MPAVQVLFAFPVGIPFTNRFREVGGTTEVVYVVRLTSTALAAGVAVVLAGRWLVLPIASRLR